MCEGMQLDSGVHARASSGWLDVEVQFIISMSGSCVWGIKRSRVGLGGAGTYIIEALRLLELVCKTGWISNVAFLRGGEH